MFLVELVAYELFPLADSFVPTTREISLQGKYSLQGKKFFMTQWFPYSHRMGRKPKDARRDEFGAWLQHLRREAKLSQEEVALELFRWLGHNVGSSTICNWERKGNLQNRKLIPVLAKIYGVSVDVLLRTNKLEPVLKGYQPPETKTYKSGEEQRKSLGKLDIPKMVLSPEEYKEFKKSMKNYKPHGR